MAIATSREELIRTLEEHADQLRRDVLVMLAEAGSGHPGGSLSSTEIIAALFFAKLRFDPRNPRWPERDRFILSKGHAAPVLYAALARCGYFPLEDLSRLRKLDKVAYVRFASVYLDFKDVREFMDELKGLLRERARR